MTQKISPPQINTISNLGELDEKTVHADVSNDQKSRNSSMTSGSSRIEQHQDTKDFKSDVFYETPTSLLKETHSEKHPKLYKKIRVRLIPILNMVFFIGLVIMNVLSSAGTIINGVRTSDISAEYFTPFTPKGWAFSIWGVIYTFIAAVVLINFVQSLIFGRDNILINHKMSIFLSLNFIVNIIWFFPFHFSARGNNGAQWAAVVFIILILLTLIVMYVRVNVNYLEPQKSESFTREKAWNHVECNLWEYWIIQPMISIYMGWISVATTLNLTIAIIYQWPSQERILLGMSYSNWTCLLLAIVLIIGLIFLSWRRDVPYAAVLSWATYAIYDQQRDDAIIAACSMVVASVLAFFVVCTVLVTLKDYIWKYHKGVKSTGKHIKKSFRKSFSFFFNGNWKNCSKDQIV